MSTEPSPFKLETSGDVRTIAVVDVGTASIRMAIAQIDASGTISLLERLTQSVPLGKDTFTNSKFRKSVIEEAVRAFKSFQQVLAEYGIPSDEVHAIATSAVQEARNRDVFVDRIYMATGIEVEVVDDTEATRLTYLSVSQLLQTTRKKTSTVVLEVGGGRTELLVLRGQEIIASRVVRLGSMRMRNWLERQHTPREEVESVLSQQVENAIIQLQPFFPETVDRLIVLGGDARFIAAHAEEDWDRKDLCEISLKRWDKLGDDLLRMSVDECVQNYRVTFAEAETLAPAVYAVSRIARALGCRNMEVSAYTMRDGMLRERAQRDGWSPLYVQQMVKSARQLGERYELDTNHAEEVAALSLQLFDALQGQHKLRARDRVLMELAAFLHEIGTYISHNSHHKHSMYIILHSTVFGLGRRDAQIVANVARYHRRSAPKSTHPVYQSLRRTDRIRVQQLAAMLRVADALSRSRGKRISTIHCERRGSNFFIHAPGADNLHLESIAMREKGLMFESVFGLSVTLVKG